MLFIYIGLFCFIIYLFSLLFFILGIYRISYKQNKKFKDIQDISIVLCVRNGAKSLPFILDDLKNQEYKGNLEFIVVDDNSDDNCREIVDFYIDNDNRFRYFNTKNSNSILRHKKRALELGISKATYEWLLFTDVDCRVPKNWALGMSENYHSSDYVIGYSEVSTSNTLVSQFQNIDFRMLMISACSSTFINYPLACSGQNQSYKKNVFDNVGGYIKLSSLLQGDDSIFLQLCREKLKLRVSFSVNKKSHVLAKTHNKWKSFILQRIRWAGDANIMWQYNRIFFLIILSTFITNFFILILLFNGLLNLFLILISIKFIFEFIIYVYGSKKIKLDINKLFFIKWFIIQIPYIVFMGAASFFVNHLSWRGR